MTGCRGGPVEVQVDDDVARLGVAVAYAVFEGPRVGGLDPRLLDAEVVRLLSELKLRYSLDALKADPAVRAYRDFYWRLGIDPTKTRPSSEALVRRALRGGFPRINPVVDAGNIASARLMVPIGLYDLNRAEPPLRLTLTRGGEEFHPIGGKPERLPPGIPVLADSRGVVLHVYPHRDSRLTAVTPETTRILALAAGVPGVSTARLRDAIAELERLLGLLSWRRCGEVEVKP